MEGRQQRDQPFTVPNMSREDHAEMLRMAFSGDSLITRSLSAFDTPRQEGLRRLIQSVNVAYTNLEFIVARPPMVPRARFHGLHVYAPARVLDELLDFGFNLFSLAHNHTMDYSEGGLRQTLTALDERSMVCAGAGMTLSEARRPRYLDIANHRVAVIGACSTDAEDTLAADPDGIVDGRPGINPLRYHAEYQLEASLFDAMSEIDEALGTAKGRQQAEALQITFDAEHEGDARRLKFLGSQFVESTTSRTHTSPHAIDVEEICRWIRDARRQSDLIVVTLHCHEGDNGEYNSNTIAEFARAAAREFIDAGADAFVGHGPHQLAGMEIHMGKPIFHSLGNFVFMPETVETLPAEFLQAAGLTAGATSADLQNRREGSSSDTKGFTAFSAFWEAVVPVCEFGPGADLRGLELWPIVLDSGPLASHRGVPRLAEGEEGAAILRRFGELSLPWGTSIDIRESSGQPVGHVGLPS